MLCLTFDLILILIDLASILAELNYSVGLRLHAHEVSASVFLRVVTGYANHAVAEITKHRNAQEADKKRLARKAASVRAGAKKCGVREIELLSGEVPEAETLITALKHQFTYIRGTCQSIHAAYCALTANLKQERQILEIFVTQTEPELIACETRLRCHIKGIERDRLLIQLTRIDGSDIHCSRSIATDEVFTTDASSDNDHVAIA